ncbi:hypothetical protein A1D18_00500 [Candidatus Rickettsiella isopodorum]|jgi:drug/metabolite transporter (DMT)-like permease|uniref:Uncharacterized protein n=1 Tax=Candidatus Rickettsiella isopodorum TaxID=1225476 RepID=A0A1J8NLC4_9COXI|nr:hypothetical protein [Candidatus Rickettsiella isopodorum]MCH9637053.1 hypothetical protein [Gammaproteobacteria bacterium]TKW76692.1 MAG: hypothetical protein DI543_19620 [Bradyrhizobium icense]MCH9754598.1 hypothetical protein [Gammaproteobacteria bacterium]MDD4892924.1 hypothetical protein [Candidatus Rickettsiella isopodorum]OIZ96249.1 hypothetical protein A1D18_00500 [Candidatus Rickettsiella isopodorum]
MPLNDKKNLGIGMMFLFSVIGFILSLFNFFLPSSPISYTGGAELVTLTTLIMTLLSVLIYYFRRDSHRWIRIGVNTLIILLLLGTLLASYFLESWSLLASVLLVGVGWFIQVFTRVKNEQTY